ncbi:glycoside hydrolase family 18 protein [Geobacillus proteiniphilus]|uniref:Glycoside hydrolase family 18 protein n=1 Tax=Geobacillus proteiniphilus TaxID=860353 RepID=A0A1Q5SL47_9BACL|nr:MULTISPECIES: glycoside hydrolase family 18 protein [Geobacillus]OKO88663.1 Spore cortex-lytic enzyme, N-acetylglucosaminidase SleL [Geobacillus proteiniphilus]OPX00492.1 spore gernimation protein [Geobacillus sp. LEMMY01]OQP11864.1 spore gernimation protein [Geobacillus thermoleovorans]QNU20277.1 glycoside hydrolase family 18 protein [Geobacillus thermoleovorans]WMJ16173.1 glycoside hydrolase family 18 protein [Geobacillus proteiniphilus]
MQIHVVQSGQTLSGIAEAYGTTVEEIVRANKLPNPDKLVVGQALVIPIVGRFYWVQRGDTLWSIARRFSIPMQRLAEVNRLSLNAPLKVGQRLYIPPGAKRRAEFNAYIEPRGATVSPALEASAREAAPYLTYLSPFYFAIRRDATLQEPPLDDFPDIARANHVTLVMVVANIENGQFSDELGALILTNKTLQNRLLDNIVATARRYGFRDIHFDFEYLRPEDREAYNAFLRKAKRRFEQEGWMMSTALAPKTSATQRGRWYEAHDYRAHGQIVDFVVIMTYEWGYSGGPPMPVSPIGPVRRVLEYAISEMPAGKILMGQNLYGYDWTLPYVPGGPYAQAISPQQAIALAAKYNVAIEYDMEAQAPHFRYRDENGRVHEVWFEDARSIQAKFHLVKKLGLRGVSYWKLGLDFPQNWLLIADQFTVVKK